MLESTAINKGHVLATYGGPESSGETVKFYAHEVNIIDDKGEVIQTNGAPDDDNPGTDAFDSLREYYGDELAVEILNEVPQDLSGHIPPTVERLNEWETVIVRVTTESIQSALISFTPK